MTKIKIISNRKKDISGMLTSKSYIGKKVMSKSGEKVGVISNVMLAGSNIEGIIVNSGLSRLFIGWEFVSSVSKDAVMLLINPATMLSGKYVFDADGKKLGKVVKVLRKGNTNTIEEIMVKKKVYSKAIKIPNQDIDTAKKNIILKKIYK